MANYDIDDQFLDDIGYKIQDEVLRAAKKSAISSQLEMKVGQDLTKLMSDKQLDEFEALMDAGANEDERLAWLEENYPDYQVVVEDVYNQLKSELKKQ